MAFFKTLFSFHVILLLAACQTTSSPSEHQRPLGWFIQGQTWHDAFQNHWVYTDSLDGQQVISFQNIGLNDTAFIAGRASQAMLSVSPYLSWSWYVHAVETRGSYPIHLVIGFHGGKDGTAPLPASAFRATLDQPQPPTQRMLGIGFHDSALQRGSFGATTQLPFYTQRGGWENTGQWHEETVDLLQLYRHYWPKDQWQRTRISFVGIMTHPHEEPSRISFGPLHLSR